MLVIPLKFRFTVLRKLSKKIALHADFSDMKKTFVSYPVFLVISDWNESVPFGTPCIYVHKRNHSPVLFSFSFTIRIRSRKSHFEIPKSFVYARNFETFVFAKLPMAHGTKIQSKLIPRKKKLFLDTVLIWRMILILGLYGRNNRRGLTIIRTLIKYSLFLLKYKYQLHEYINIYKAI